MVIRTMGNTSEADDRPEATDLLTFCQLPMRPNRSTGHEAGLAGQWVRAFQEALLLQKAARKESATSKPRQLEPRRVRPKPVSKVTKKRLLTYNISKAYGARTAQIILLAPI
ncbi:hypothetical protein RvY_15120-2 [Ramazzottius varieornatus]|uniref:Uncharacterized protein n=1 Tax=Ramazzottius varieornatus TaxID=947166 RepID=A0A1D1VTU5_RAMVA|nr:hypothetical protein RvY_15120-2 [Ramazzottius varieornatus]